MSTQANNAAASDNGAAAEGKAALGGAAGGKRGSGSKGKAPSLRERLSAWSAEHGFLTGVGVAIVVAAALGLTLWFTVFSGLSGSADFVYSQF